MTTQTPGSDEIFPKDTGKTYALVELVRGESSLVGKGPDETVFAFPIVLCASALWRKSSCADANPPNSHAPVVLR